MPERDNFRTLRGFMTGEEPDEGDYFAYSATLRICGDIGDLDAITQNMGFSPTHAHRKGERKGPKSPPYENDQWSLAPPLREEEPLERHIDALWSMIREKRQYLLDLKKTLTIDVFLGYRSNSDTAGVEVPYQSLEMFMELEIPFGLSIIIA